MNKAILNREVQEFIEININTDPVKISLGKSPFPGVSPAELAEQIDSKKRCENKLPTWFMTKGIYYPKKLAIEQCSSEQAANYKSGLIKGDQVADLTGGFGVDAAFFSPKAGQVTHCETDRELSEISAFNSRVLGFKITYVQRDGISFLQGSEESFDTIYIDPSRRADSGKVFRLKDCVPDVIAHKELLLKKSKRLLIKTAPLLDPHSAMTDLGNVAEIHIVSIKNECREVLYLLDQDIKDAEPNIICAMLDKSGDSFFSFRFSEEKAFQTDRFSVPQKYLYEPDVALLKAGCFKLITKYFDVDKLHQHTHLYTSQDLREAFPGRKFKILDVWDYGVFQKQKAIRTATIICRNFPLKPDKIRKKLRINDGGSDYLVFCRSENDRLIVARCERI